jgi:hypothetical protein
VGADGGWKLTVGDVASGQHVIVALQTDAAGNHSPTDTAQFDELPVGRPAGDGLFSCNGAGAGARPDVFAAAIVGFVLLRRRKR